MKWFCFLAVFALACLSAAAVWMGGLNQDEGWYLYAANLVAEGRLPYRDFFFTQGPVMPIVYSAFSWVWKSWGLLGARVFTLSLGLVGVLLAVVLARRLAPPARRGEAAVVALLLLGSNLYHLYFVTIPKTYSLASLFVLAGFVFLCVSRDVGRIGVLLWATASGVSLALAAGTRISLGAILAVVGLFLLAAAWRSRERGDLLRLAGFAAGGLGALALVYGPFLASGAARGGLVAAQSFHAARGGFDVTWVVGSLSRLVRWYLPVFVAFGLGAANVFSGRRLAEGGGMVHVVLSSFLAVFVVQLLAPFPYEDYQVPVMGLMAAASAAVLAASGEATAGEPSGPRARVLLLVLGMTWASSFGSPLLESWSTNGHDRFWALKKDRCELAQLRDVARRIEALDPGGDTLFTQDVYLAVETNRRVPGGFEMGPFSVLSDEDIVRAIDETESPVAALSGYSFAIEMPAGTERPIGDQMRYWELLKKKYALADREDAFGQNSTPLLILKRK